MLTGPAEPCYFLVNARFTPKGITEYLDLRRPIYKQTAAYGHFGRTEPGFTWEATGKTAELKKFFKL